MYKINMLNSKKQLQYDSTKINTKYYKFIFQKLFCLDNMYLLIIQLRNLGLLALLNIIQYIDNQLIKSSRSIVVKMEGDKISQQPLHQKLGFSKIKFLNFQSQPKLDYFLMKKQNVSQKSNIFQNRQLQTQSKQIQVASERQDSQNIEEISFDSEKQDIDLNQSSQELNIDSNSNSQNFDHIQSKKQKNKQAQNSQKQILGRYIKIKQRQRIYQQIVDIRIQPNKALKVKKKIKQIAEEQSIWVQQIEAWVFQYDTLAQISRRYQQNLMEDEQKPQKLYQIFKSFIINILDNTDQKILKQLTSLIFSKYRQLISKLKINKSSTLLNKIINEAKIKTLTKNNVQTDKNKFIDQLFQTKKSQIIRSWNNYKQPSQIFRPNRNQKQSYNIDNMGQESLSKPQRINRKYIQKQNERKNKLLNIQTYLSNSHIQQSCNKDKKLEPKFDVEKYYAKIVQRMDQNLLETKMKIAKIFKQGIPPLFSNSNSKLKIIYYKYGKHSITCECSLNRIKTGFEVKKQQIQKLDLQQENDQSQSQIMNETQRQLRDYERLKKRVAEEMDKKLQDQCASIYQIFDKSAIQLCLQSSHLKQIYSKQGKPII